MREAVVATPLLGDVDGEESRHLLVAGERLGVNDGDDVLHLPVADAAQVRLVERIDRDDGVEQPLGRELRGKRMPACRGVGPGRIRAAPLEEDELGMQHRAHAEPRGLAQLRLEVVAVTRPADRPVQVDVVLRFAEGTAECVVREELRRWRGTRNQAERRDEDGRRQAKGRPEEAEERHRSTGRGLRWVRRRPNVWCRGFGFSRTCGAVRWLQPNRSQAEA